MNTNGVLWRGTAGALHAIVAPEPCAVAIFGQPEDLLEGEL
jgi:hypothetical protein